ncbi:MAG: FHA domain-containing protein [Planctomycetota bacterium]
MAVRIHGAFGSWILPVGESVLGRSPSCSVSIDDPRLSRKHARFVVTGETVVVYDLGSTNGVLVNGVKIAAPCPLAHGAIVVCGPATMTIAIDQTQPHPVVAEGAQDPATRRAPTADQTLALHEQETALDRPVASGRGIDPAIAEAVGSTPVAVLSPVGAYDPRMSAFQPAQAPGSISSPLAAVRPNLRVDEHKKRSPATTTGLEAMEMPGSSTGALDPPRMHPAVWDRYAAGLADGLSALAAAVPGLLIMVFSYGEALSLAGGKVYAGVVQFGPGPASGPIDLALTLGNAAGFGSAVEAATMAAGTSLTATVVLVGGSALGALLTVIALLFILVVPTTLHGAPWFHRKRGLHLVRVSGWTRLTWTQACVRWALALLLWPLALVTVMLRVRSIHDRLSGSAWQRSQHGFSGSV